MPIRPSPIAGKWYPAEAETLSQHLQHYLQQAEIDPPAKPLRGIVVPHAGYRYSAGVAAYAFNCLGNVHPELVVLTGPLHYPHPAHLLTTGHKAYQTPLGLVEVNTEAIDEVNRALRHRLGYGLTPIRDDPEHSLEIELPFLQHVLGQFQLLPIMIRDQSFSVVKALGDVLAETLSDQQILLVASSDLSHFYPQAQACQLDKEILSRLEAFDPQAVLEAEVLGLGFACGRGAIAATLWVAKALGATQVKVVRQATSGDVSGDYSSVVGYGAAIIW